MTNPHDTASAALRYIDRGWAVVALHDVATGVCSCGSADPEHAAGQGGKHPVAKGWQNAGLRSIAAVSDAWARRPGANIGIVTGRASGIWVLDVDPLHGGDKQLAALVAAYGALPETYTVRTGSGGRHYYWTMPDFDFTTSRGRLPLGLDVRGNAGQVVAPPSYTLRGTYSVLVDVPVVAAPAWLLGLIKPVEREAVERTPESEFWTSGPGSASTLDRGRAYATVAVRELLGQLATAQPGERNVTAYRVGRRLAELVASPWAGLDGEVVSAWYLDAAARCDVDGGFSQSEAMTVLTRAVRDQGGRGVDLPAPDHLGTRVDWVPPSDFDQAGQDPANPFTSPGQPGRSIDVAGQLINGPPGQGEDLDPFEVKVREQVGWLMVRDEAARRMRSAASARSPIQIMDREAQQKMPRMVPLIAGWLGRGQAARIYGPPGAGKSFAAVDMAACIAQGVAWHGRAVAQGEVVYFAVEDAEGIAMRLRAWELHHQVEHRVHMVCAPVQMNVETVHRVLAAVQEYFEQRPVALIVLDTQAMVTVGMDENSVADMGIFVEAVKLLANRTGATVLTVHHSGVRGGRARGSTSVLGAMDVELEASMNGTSMTLSTVKTKNVAKPPALMTTLNVVDLDERDAFGTPITSCVLVAADDASGPFTSPAGPGLSQLAKRALAIATVLMETAASGETYSRVRTRATLVTDFGQAPSSITSAFSKAWNHLVELGRIAKAQGREAYYFIDIEGLERLAPNPDKLVSGGPEIYTGEA